MSNDQNWITGRITEARKPHPSVTESVSARMKELLSDQFSERQLSKTELTSVAKELIASMVPTPSDAKQ
jgi:hypothetical protein